MPSSPSPSTASGTNFSPVGSSPHLTLDDALAMASKYILVTNATGNQGSAVVAALAQNPAFTLLAQTRNTASPGAQKLAARGANVQLVEGSLDDVPALFQSARAAAGSNPLWGVYSVQISVGTGVTHEGEIAQGKAMVDEAMKAGVQHFVYGSVERGGDEASWGNPTPVQHFQSKYEIERYLRDRAGETMGWTILRPVAFMDNLQPGFPTRVFMAALRDTLGPTKPLQFIAVKDIGILAAQAFTRPQDYDRRALGLAGDELTVGQIGDVFAAQTGARLEGTWWALGAVLKYLVGDMGRMVEWFGSEGYGADIAGVRRLHPGLMDLGTWIREESKFPKV